MDASFWHDRWTTGNIGFHEGEANRLLVEFGDELGLADGDRVFVPLCGKTRDIAWLLSRGYQVVGVELSEIAVVELFEELGVEPDSADIGSLKVYRSDGIDIFVGDFFDLSKDVLRAVDAIYDRAALVALPEDMRTRYARHLVAITDNARQLLICFVYDQQLMTGPPFSIDDDIANRHYSHHYDMRLLAEIELVDGLKGKHPATEKAWLLTRRRSARP